MWVKICANTNLDDALLAAELGASAVGFVFAPSPRQITPAHAGSISSRLPVSVERIGVFQSQNAREILDASKEAGLTGIQLHGNLDLGLVQRLQDACDDRITIIQTLHWDVGLPAVSAATTIQQELLSIHRESKITRVLVDSRVGGVMGGTGVRFDWSLASTLTSDFAHLKLIAAGGLNSDNVADAIRSLRPWGVDVASGVERSPGLKDPKKLEAFIRASAISSPV